MWTDSQLTTEKLLRDHTVEKLFIGIIDNEAATTMILQTEE